MIDVIGLAGDAVDNIPGVPGVGAKTAQKLLGDYGSVENLIDHVDELKGKLQERIRDHAEQALLSKQLAVIDVDVPLAVEIESLQRQPFNRDALIGLFDKLEFAFLKKRLFGEGDQPELTAADDQAEPGPVAELKTLADIDHDYQVAATHEERQQLMQQLAKQKLFCFDLETTSLDAKIAASGSLSAADAFPVHLDVTQGPASQFAYFVTSATLNDPGINVASGRLCVGAPLARFSPGTATASSNPQLNSLGQFDSAGVLQSLSGNSSTGAGFDVPQIIPDPINGTIAPGSTWVFQLWYRDGPTSNFSTAAVVTFG